MARGAFVGAEGPWITAAAGVFYAANLRKTTEAGASYRFACSAPALAVLSRIHASLSAGEVPSDVPAEDFAKVDFQMDFPDSAAKRFNPFGKGKGEPELTLGVVPLRGEGAQMKPAGDGWSALLSCSVLVVHARVPGVEGARKPVEEDAAIAEVAQSIARQGRGAPLRACIQWWLPGPPAVKPSKGAKDGEEPPPAIPPTDEKGARGRLSADMVEGFLPRTRAVLEGAGAGAPSSFFAWLKPDRRGGGVRVARRQLFDVGGVEPDYPYEELTAMIDQLGRLVA